MNLRIIRLMLMVGMMSLVCQNSAAVSMPSLKMVRRSFTSRNIGLVAGALVASVGGYALYAYLKKNKKHHALSTQIPQEIVSETAAPCTDLFKESGNSLSNTYAAKVGGGGSLSSPNKKYVYQPVKKSEQKIDGVVGANKVRVG